MSESSDAPRPRASQPNWRFCRRCLGLFWFGATGNGVCPAGGEHDASGSWNYSLPYSEDRA
jgi:hypothetical protein